MADTMKGLKRTDMNGTLNENNIGQNVVLTGWVAKTRNLGSIIFIDLRDRSGLIQLVFDGNSEPAIFDKAIAIRGEFVLAIQGLVRPRSPEAVNKNMFTGGVEVFVKDLRILSEADTPPIQIDEKVTTSDVNRLKYRYLDLRKPSIQKNFILRHHIARIAREYFGDNGFLEVETPILCKSTPEGARDYLVPSRVHEGKFYALPQSPQLFKQLLMVAGFDRYMQIAKCFRDEDLRADRQPEFTQIDLEMSFVDVDDVITINEGYLKKLFKELMNIDLTTPFPRMKYSEAMRRYGNDKPDIRFGLELIDISEWASNCSFSVFKDSAIKKNEIGESGAVKLICAQGAGSYTRKQIDALTEFVKAHGGFGMAWIAVGENEIRSSLGKVLSTEEISYIIETAQAKSGDLICIVSGESDMVNTVLGSLRCDLAEKLGLIQKDTYAFLWVTEFPVFEYSVEEHRYMAKHHPFTAPADEDVDTIESNPHDAKAKAYDIVLNGSEIGGGSIRIHNKDLQAKMFRALGFTDEEAKSRFGFLTEAFRYGTPPHGGMAYGLDRLTMIMAGCDSIKDVIAFPKVQNASDIMSNAPDFVENKQLVELHIEITKEETK